MNQESELTRIFVPQNLVGWTTLRVQTASSEYHVAFGPLASRRVAVLRGTSHGEVLNQTDGDPRVGEVSLFAVAPGEWVGQRLQVGSVTTSVVLSVVPERSASVLAQLPTWVGAIESRPIGDYAAIRAEAVRAAAEAAVRAAAPPEPVGAELYLALVASAARRLGRVRAAPDLREAFDREPALRERFGDALAECLLLVRAIAANV